MKPVRLTWPLRFVATCWTSCGCPTRACPSSNGFVADLTAYDFVALRFEILRCVPETLIPDHRLHRPESATPGPGKLGSTLHRYSGAMVNAANRFVSGKSSNPCSIRSYIAVARKAKEGAGARRCEDFKAEMESPSRPRAARAPWRKEHRTQNDCRTRAERRARWKHGAYSREVKELLAENRRRWHELLALLGGS